MSRLLTGVVLLVGCGVASDDEGARRDETALEPASTSEPSSPVRSIDRPASSSQPARRLMIENVLVFSATAGYRHDSIGAGVVALRNIADREDFEVTATEDASIFSDAALEDFEVVVFLNTTGDVLDPNQQGALERFVRGGGGWVGIHSAADTEYNWPFYGELLGNAAWFLGHPPGTSPATLQVDPDNAAHPAVAALPSSFMWDDEWYAFRTDPGETSTVLLRLDESTYDATSASMGADHPISWSHDVDAGRAWYTGVGHRAALYQDAAYQAHLLGGISWAAGLG